MVLIDSAAVQAAMLEKAVGVMELAKLAKIPPRTIVAAHKRDIRVNLPTVARLARALNVEAQSIIKAVI